jgi:hypothetical protein
LKIIADFEPGEQAIIRTMEAVFASTRSPHWNEQASMQPTVVYFLKKINDSQPSTSAPCFLKKVVEVLNIFLKLNSIYVCVYEMCTCLVNRH